MEVIVSVAALISACSLATKNEFPAFPQVEVQALANLACGACHPVKFPTTPIEVHVTVLSAVVVPAVSLNAGSEPFPAVPAACVIGVAAGNLRLDRCISRVCGLETHDVLKAARNAGQLRHAGRCIGVIDGDEIDLDDHRLAVAKGVVL